MKNNHYIIVAILAVALMLSGCGTADDTDVALEEEVLGIQAPVFAVTSENLHDGVWDQVISNTDNGQNVSPQLSWEPVAGASEYVIYMSDTNMQDFIHWKSNHVTETTLPQGWASETDYIGPYPPSGGTHTYEIYVIALKEGVERAKGGVNSANPKFQQNVQSLDDTTDGKGGNILAVGHLAGTYTNL